MSMLCLHARGQSVSTLKKEIAQAEAEIKKSNELLKSNKSKQKTSLSNLTLVASNIKNRKSIIESLDKQITLIKGEISGNNKSIDSLSSRLDKLKKEYAAIVVTAYKEYKTGSYLTFLFAAKDFNDMTRRAAYLKRHMEIRRQKGEEIVSTRSRIEEATARLHGQQKELSSTMTTRSEEIENLSAEEKQYKQEIEKLRKEEKNLSATIAKNRNTIASLQKEIRKIIEEQARKNKQSGVDLSKLTGSFSAAKGKLPYPVSGGVITEHFGIHPHPLQPSLKVDNKGITFSSKEGTTVKSVFEGDVSKVFFFQGMGTTVMIRHGNYISVYSNLSKATVKTGAKVKAGTAIGVVGATNGGYTVHFELWKETTPINPEPWFAK